MQITVKLFAMLKDKAGANELLLDVPSGASVARAVEALTKQYPSLAGAIRGVAVAVNLSRVNDQTVLQDGDELALLPPVSGG
jgi:molybdopterin converting factor subunit 1